jgi:hypothetical protein
LQENPSPSGKKPATNLWKTPTSQKDGISQHSTHSTHISAWQVLTPSLQRIAPYTPTKTPSGTNKSSSQERCSQHGNQDTTWSVLRNEPLSPNVCGITNTSTFTPGSSPKHGPISLKTPLSLRGAESYQERKRPKETSKENENPSPPKLEKEEKNRKRKGNKLRRKKKKTKKTKYVKEYLNLANRETIVTDHS